MKAANTYFEINITAVDVTNLAGIATFGQSVTFSVQELEEERDEALKACESS